eukprot:2893730-Rhodomonas_salina.12
MSGTAIVYGSDVRYCDRVWLRYPVLRLRMVAMSGTVTRHTRCPVLTERFQPRNFPPPPPLSSPFSSLLLPSQSLPLLFPLPPPPPSSGGGGRGGAAAVPRLRKEEEEGDFRRVCCVPGSAIYPI